MQRYQTRTLVLYALFMALTLLLGMTPIGLIPLGFINLTVLHIPTIVAAIVLGTKGGLVVGALFGLASTLSALGLSPMVPQSGLAAALVAVNPFYVIAMCFIPRLLIPVTTSALYRLCVRKGQKFAVGGAAIVGSLTNTIFYLGLMLVFYHMAGLDSTPVVAVIGGTGLIAAPMEALAAMLIAIPVVAAVKKTEKSQDKRG